MLIPKPLPDRWWITPPISSLDELPDLLEKLDERIGQGIRHVEFMQKTIEEGVFKEIYQKFSAYCAAKKVFLVIHGTSELAQELEVEGCCYYAKDLINYSSRPLPEEYWVGVHCHDVNELKMAERLGVDFASLSIVKPSACYPGRPAMGWDVFEESIKQVSLPVYAVGGLNLADLPEALKRGAQGIMGIRYDYPAAI